MSLLAADPLTQLAFSVYESKGVFAVLLGSGLSRAAEIPTGWEITLDLIRRVGLAQGAEQQTDWAVWYRTQTGEEPNYSALLEELSSSPEERRSILQSYIEPNEEDRNEGRKISTAAHHAFADLVRGGYIRVIVTTNFDRLMENALRECGIEPTIVGSVDALAGAEPISHSACYILKLHGDYKDARILNTDSELNAYPEAYDGLLDRIFDEHGLIVCGWSGEWDHALRAAFLRAPNRRYSVFWAACGKLGTVAQDLVAHRRARVIPITDADKFFETLRQRVVTLEQSQRQNPLSFELLVASAKRFLAKPEYRIQLDELFTQETERVLTQLDAVEFTPSAGWNQAVFRARVRKYEAVTEALACMAGVLGRLGDDSHSPLVIDIIRSLYAHAEAQRGGLNYYLNIRSYPAVLVFTAFGLGLTRAGRWSALHQLFQAVIEQEREPAQAVTTLFLMRWKGTENNAWKQIEDLEKRKTPVSDHSFSLFTDWGKHFLGLTPDFQMVFDRFEMLGALAYLGNSDKSSVQQALAEKSGHNFTWMPLGRSCWNGNLEKLMNELEDPAQKSLLTQAGFGEGDPEFIDLFIPNFKRLAGAISWR